MLDPIGRCGWRGCIAAELVQLAMSLLRIAKRWPESLDLCANLFA
ncbi:MULTISPECIES: hypothetical protein [unclassified Mesorhizobium]|nr:MULTISPECIES: hypothetical protein [unclassified Mesorhizobium]